MKALRWIVCVAAASALAACEPTVRTHGFMPPAETLDRIQVGVDTRDTVQRKIGRPSLAPVFDARDWYYVSSKVEHFAFYEPTVIDREVLAIGFDEAGRVASVNRYGLEDGRVVDLEARTTPTYGRQLTILEQLLGNLGSLRGEDFFEE